MSDSSEIFTLPVRVYYEDTDAQGVVYYANYFRFMERARTEWLRALGVDMVQLQEQQRRIFVVAEVQAKFLSPARLSDNLIVTVSLADLSRASFSVEQKIYRHSMEGELLISGLVKAAYLDADSMRPKRVPNSIFEGSKS